MRWAVVPVALTLACGNPLDVAIVAVDVDGDVVVSPHAPGEFRVTVENRGGERVVWGLGSSSCQLSLDVIVGSERHRIDFRVCTEDLVQQGLDPGGTRTETFVWGGQVLTDGELEMLPDGTYRVFGIAGDRAESDRLRVSVQGS